MNKNISTKSKTTSRGPWNYFSSCHICMGMKQERGATAGDLTKLFKEAEEKNETSGQTKTSGTVGF